MVKLIEFLVTVLKNEARIVARICFEESVGQDATEVKSSSRQVVHTNKWDFTLKRN